MPQQHTTGDQVNFLGQWFGGWSEMQREDFMPVLVQAYKPKDHINGLLEGMEALRVQGRRPSLFDCQVKLFHDWFNNWTEGERSRLLQLLRDTDPDFMALYDKEVGVRPQPQTATTEQTEASQTSEEGQNSLEEAQNPPSSISSPPSTLPRSHSPHDSGLDEPPSDSDHTEPHSLESSHEPEVSNLNQTPSTTTEDSSTPPPLPVKTLAALEPQSPSHDATESNGVMSSQQDAAPVTEDQ